MKVCVVMGFLAPNMQKHTRNYTAPTPQLSEQDFFVQPVEMSILYPFVQSCLEALRKHCPLTRLARPE